MARLPDKTAVGEAVFARRPAAAISGGAAVGAGLKQVGKALTAIGEAENKEADALDLIKADAQHKTDMYRVKREFDEDPDYATFEPRFRERSATVTTEAASHIRNPALREKWLLKSQPENEQDLQGVLNRGTNLKRQDRIVEIEDALKQHQGIYADPNSDEARRRQARADIDATIRLGVQNGILEPKVASVLRERYDRGSVIEDARTRLLTDPVGLRNDLAGDGGAEDKPRGDAIGRAAAQTGVSDHLLRTIAKIESGGNAGARTGSYKGLFQLSDAEFDKHGGGDIYNANDNALAAANKIKAESAAFEASYGRAPSATDIYLIHQQGKGGYQAHVSNPELPAWMNMFSTAEGQQKGEAWAKLAIWGNVPDDVKERFGSVENVTSGDFIKLWDEKIHRIGGAGGAVSPRYADLTPLERAEFIDKSRKQQASLLEGQREQLKRALDDDEESIRRTGVSTNPDLKTASQVLEANQINRYLLNRKAARMEYDAMHDLPGLTEAGLQERLDAIEPKPGEEGYDVKARVYDKAVRKADELRQAREADPARSVEELPEVVSAAQAAGSQPDNPEAIQALVRARLDAQDGIGIPPGLQSPITKAEARVLVSPLRGLEGDALKVEFENVLSQIEERYGPYARAAGIAAIDLAITRDKDLAERFEGLISKTMKGLQPRAAEIREFEFLTEAVMADRAFAYRGDPMAQYGQVPLDAGVPGEALPPSPFQTFGQSPGQMVYKSPPQAAKAFLLQNPATQEDFDRKYGPGSAQKVMDEAGE